MLSKWTRDDKVGLVLFPILTGMGAGLISLLSPIKFWATSLVFLGFATATATLIFFLKRVEIEDSEKEARRKSRVESDVSDNLCLVQAAVCPSTLRNSPAAPRPDMLGTVQFVSRSGQLCSFCRVHISDILETIDVDGTPRNNLIGRACPACGGCFVENPDALYAGKLAPIVLGKDNVIAAIKKWAAANAPAAADTQAEEAQLLQRERELRDELARVQDRLQKIAFEAGKPLLPDHPHRG